MTSVVPGPEPLRGDRAVPLFGRSEIHDAALGTLEEAVKGSGQFVLLVGEGGVGKSTLLRQVVRDAAQRGFRVVTGRALPSDLPQPFALVQDLIRSLQREEGEAPVAGAEDPSLLSLFLAPYATDARGSELPGGTVEDEADHLLTYLAGPPARVEESRTTLYDRLNDFFSDLARSRPLLLAIDDLHFADDPSIEFLEQFTQRLGRTRIALLATVVPTEESPARTAHLMERLLTGDRTTRLTVRPMTEPEVVEYARWILKGRDPGREAVMRWYTQTDGNPLFVEYVVRGSMGLGTGGVAPTGTPQDLDEILRGRVRGLSEADRRVLVYATVLGKEFDFATLAVAAGGKEEERLAESVDRLVHATLFREKGGEVYEFVSERIRAEAYAQLTETRRRILHRKVARALEARGSNEAASVFELARQFYLAREDGPSLQYNRRAAELASRTFAHDSAVVHLERALESLRRQRDPDPSAELHLMVELGRLLGENEQLRESEEALNAAVERARAHPNLTPELALALLWLARTRSDRGEFVSALALAQEAYAILDRAGNRRGLLVAHRVLGIAYWRNGDLPEAEEHQREEIALAEAEDDPWERGHALIDLANTLVSRGMDRAEEALRLYETAGGLFSDTRDYAAQARVAMNMALLYHNTDRFDRGEEALGRATEFAERSHSHIWIGYCRMNQTQFHVERKRIPEARASLARAREMLGPLGDQFAEQQLRMLEGMIHEAEGELTEAAGSYQEALSLARQLRFEGEVAEMLFRSARLAGLRGAPAEARELLLAARKAGLGELKAELLKEAAELERSLPGPPGTGPETDPP